MTKIAPMYVYATEMVASYYQRLKLKNKRVLTVIGSGDQVINALYFGAREVIGFDINRNALFMTELKLAAISTLSYQEFLKFFSQTKTGFDYKLYLKIRLSMSQACQKYFDQLYKEVRYHGLGTSEYFRNRDKLIYKNKNNVLQINAYLKSESSYKKMKSILVNSRPILYVENVLTLTDSKKLRGKKFNVINLSNVPNYLTGRSFGLSEEDVLSYFRKLKKLVSTRGTIFFYSYNDSIYPHSTAPVIPPISRTSFIRKIKQTGVFNISMKSFSGIFGKSDRITVLGC